MTPKQFKAAKKRHVKMYLKKFPSIFQGNSNYIYMDEIIIYYSVN